MKQPRYRWVCTMCGISDEAESSEVARLTIDVHVQMAHPSSQRAVRVRPDPARDLMVLGRDQPDQDARDQAAEENDRDPGA